MTIRGLHESRNSAQRGAPASPASADDRTAARTASSRPLKLAYVLAVVNAIVIGVSFLLVKLTLAYADPIDTLTYRFAAAFLLLGVPAACGIVKLNYRDKPFALLLLLASLYPVGYFLLQTTGLQYATSAEGGIISAFTPIATMVLASFFLKEQTTLLQKLFIVLSTLGVLFIFAMKGSGINMSTLTGMALLLVACVLFAAYSVLARAVTRRFSPAEISCFMVGAAFVSMLLVSLTAHSAAGTLDAFVAPLANGVFVAVIVSLGVVQCATAFMANYVLSRIEASKMSVFANLSTVVSIAAGAIFLQEAVTWYHLAGSALIIAGVIGTNVSAKRALSVQPQPQETFANARS
ncbi:hypothetical protein PAESOLCIP111_05103 [Paenibacillus solanacearum]|uniref:EamA domain-containing protein n=1 Tax=Paenibacillus solanacearum TaxID=2048548 RepID=A0A916K5I4_9BACL|nr:DMT family transporter [Paenibacillus solanacearum]CAG7646117.1 hypothetical protein PAESOLCIP111_05103 [Paenibacillus solanacearum]